MRLERLFFIMAIDSCRISVFNDDGRDSSVSDCRCTKSPSTSFIAVRDTTKMITFTFTKNDSYVCYNFQQLDQALRASAMMFARLPCLSYLFGAVRKVKMKMPCCIAEPGPELASLLNIRASGPPTLRLSHLTMKMAMLFSMMHQSLKILLTLTMVRTPSPKANQVFRRFNIFCLQLCSLYQRRHPGQLDKPPRLRVSRGNGPTALKMTPDVVLPVLPVAAEDLQSSQISPPMGPRIDFGSSVA